MSYLIQYGPEEPFVNHQKASKLGVIGGSLIILICLLAFGWYLPRQAQQFRQALFPWTRQEVVSAFAELREDVKGGAALDEAVTDFCREIIHEAERNR